MSVIQFPDRAERIKAQLLTRYRRELAFAGHKVSDEEIQHALDEFVPRCLCLIDAEMELNFKLAGLRKLFAESSAGL